MVSDGYELISVRGNGAGFDPPCRDRFSGPFQRPHHERDFQVHGVGLVTVTQTVLKHAGQVDSEGQPGGDATFRFSLPQR